MVVLARIDDRLIHGQVVEGWVNYLKATWLIVADDAVAGNPVQRSIMEISVPEGLRVLIGTVEEVSRTLRTPGFAKERVILLFSRPRDVVRYLDAGEAWANLNIGGMRYVPGKRKVLDVLALDDADVEALREIQRRKVRVEVQTVPTERPRPLEKLLADLAS